MASKYTIQSFLNNRLKLATVLTVFAILILIFIQGFVINEAYKRQLITFDSLAHINLINTIEQFSIENADNNAVGIFDLENNKVLIEQQLNKLSNVNIEEYNYSSTILRDLLYDARDTTAWTADSLAAIYSETLEESGITHPEFSFTLKDNNGNVIDSYYPSYKRFGTVIHCDTIQLGFIAQHTLYANIKFPISSFICEAWDKIIFIFLLFITLTWGIIVLIELLKREKRENKNREFFTEALVHNLRSPLAVAKRSLETMLFSWHDISQEQASQIQISIRQCNSIADCIDDILNAYVDENGIKLYLDYTDIVPILEKLQIMYETLSSDRKKIKVNLHIPPEIPEILIDAVHFEKALSNIVENGVKYSGPDTVIDITCTLAKKSLSISVKDNGKGIDKRSLSKIFDKYYRENRHCGVKGFGLGLHYVLMIVKAHKAKIKVRSEIGKGTEFTITFHRINHGEHFQTDIR